MRILPLLFLPFLLLSTSVFAHAANPPAGAPAALGLSLSASPKLVDVGDPVVLTVTAKQWPGPASATVSFVSPHHGFSGTMQWKQGCSCFQASILLAKRIHPLETAKATAKVTIKGKAYTLAKAFTIRGLAPGGKDYAGGGQMFLASWVADPSPAIHQDEHICGWVFTADGLGVPGYHIHFTIHYPKTKQSWNSRVTDRSGVACSQRKVLPLTARTTIHIDATTAGLKSATSFTSGP